MRTTEFQNLLHNLKNFDRIPRADDPFWRLLHNFWGAERNFFWTYSIRKMIASSKRTSTEITEQSTCARFILQEISSDEAISFAGSLSGRNFQSFLGLSRNPCPRAWTQKDLDRIPSQKTNPGPSTRQKCFWRASVAILIMLRSGQEDDCWSRPPSANHAGKNVIGVIWFPMTP